MIVTNTSSFSLFFFSVFILLSAVEFTGNTLYSLPSTFCKNRKVRIEGGISANHIEFAAYSLNIPDVKAANSKKIEINNVNKKNNADNTSIKRSNNNRSLITILHR